MKRIFGLFVFVMAVTAFASSAFSLSNPLIRVCTVNEGTFEVYKDGADEFATCRWGQAVIDSQSILSGLEGLTTEAASVILSDMTGASCDAVSATDFVLPTGQVLCVFSDESKLSVEATRAGLSDNDRVLLKKALLAR